MLESFNPEVHHQLNKIACCADFVVKLVYWSYGSRTFSCGSYSEIADHVKKMQNALQVLESLEKRLNDVV